MRTKGPLKISVDGGQINLSAMDSYIVACIEEPVNDEDRANAAWIQRLWNEGDGLLESLKWALNRIRTANLGEGEYFERAEKAVARAEGRE